MTSRRSVSLFNFFSLGIKNITYFYGLRRVFSVRLLTLRRAKPSICHDIDRPRPLFSTSGKSCLKRIGKRGGSMWRISVKLIRGNRMRDIRRSMKGDKKSYWSNPSLKMLSTTDWQAGLCTRRRMEKLPGKKRRPRQRSIHSQSV